MLVRAVVSDYGKGQRLLKEEKNNYGIKLEVLFLVLFLSVEFRHVLEQPSRAGCTLPCFCVNLESPQHLMLTLQRGDVPMQEHIFRAASPCLQSCDDCLFNNDNEEHNSSRKCYLYRTTCT